MVSRAGSATPTRRMAATEAAVPGLIMRYAIAGRGDDGVEREHDAERDHHTLEQLRALLYLNVDPSFRHVPPHPT